jgi:eukaryotic-like serine/threonine-protein kinase
LSALAHAYALAGRTEEARIILDDMTNDKMGRYVASPMIARIHLGLGEFEMALDWLERGVEERSYWMVFLKEDPVYDPIRTYPRFRELLSLIGLAS